MTSFVIGQKVRCLCSGSGHSRKAVIASVSTEGVDLIYDSSNAKLQWTDEETICPLELQRITNLQSFELDHDLATPNESKERGNILFGLKDFEQATIYYNTALSNLLIGDMCVGATVIVSSTTNMLDYNTAMISDVDNDSYDVIFDDKNIEDESNICRSRLIIVAGAIKDPNVESLRSLQRSLYMNLGKCAMKLSRPGWAVRWTSLANAITRTSIQLNNMMQRVDICNNSHGAARKAELRKNLLDEHVMLANCLLLAGRPMLARKEICMVEALDQSKAAVLSKEVDSFLKKRKTSNKKLARDVAEWVDTAMTLSASASASTQAKNSTSTSNSNEEEDDEASALIGADDPDDEEVQRCMVDLTGKPATSDTGDEEGDCVIC